MDLGNDVSTIPKDYRDGSLIGTQAPISSRGGKTKRDCETSSDQIENTPASLLFGGKQSLDPSGVIRIVLEK